MDERIEALRVQVAVDGEKADQVALPPGCHASGFVQDFLADISG
jgi:hypothetical protein